MPFVRKKTFHPKRKTALPIAMKALREVNKLKEDIEVKYHDTITGPTTITSSGDITRIAQIPSDTTNQGRIGDSVKTGHVELRITFETSTAQVAGTAVRMILFRGKKENQVLYTSADILDASGIRSPYNFTERNRFTVLKDVTFTMDDLTVGGKNKNSMVLFKKLVGKITFGAGNSNYENGGVYLLFITDVAANQPNYKIHSRVTFTDP